MELIIKAKHDSISRATPGLNLLFAEKLCCQRCVAVSISRFNRTFCIGVRPSPRSLMSIVSKQS